MPAIRRATPLVHRRDKSEQPSRIHRHHVLPDPATSTFVFGKLCRSSVFPLEFVPHAGVVQWQNESFPSFRRGFDSHHPLKY